MSERKVSSNVVKIAQALGFLLALDENHKMNKVKLVKLLWEADRLHIRKYGRMISDADDYYAMTHGPVCSLALDIAQMSKDRIAFSDDDIEYLEDYFTSDDRDTSMQKEVGDNYLSDTDKEALTKAWELFKDKEAFDLADNISHKYPEWARYADYFKNNGGRKHIFTEDFFENPENDEYFKEDRESLEAAREYYLENQAAKRELNEILGVSA